MGVLDETKKQLCKLIVNKGGYAQLEKGLWINLWKLWKSSAFPQLQLKFPQSGPGKMMHIFSYNPSVKVMKRVLRYRYATMGKWWENVEKVGKYHNRARAGEAVKVFFGRKICNNRQKYTARIFWPGMAIMGVSVYKEAHHAGKGRNLRSEYRKT